MANQTQTYSEQITEAVKTFTFFGVPEKIIMDGEDITAYVVEKCGGIFTWLRRIVNAFGFNVTSFSITRIDRAVTLRVKTVFFRCGGMKVGNFIKTTAADYCVDVYDNYTEELAIAYCGEKLTDEGIRHFRKALVLNIEAIYKNTVIIEVCRKDLTEEQSEANLAAAKDLFESMAGLCAADDYKKWFKA